MSSSELQQQGVRLYRATSGPCVNGSIALTLPAGVWNVNSKVVSIVKAGGVLTAPYYVKSVSIADNTNVATLTLQSSSGGAGETGTMTITFSTPQIANA